MNLLIRFIWNIIKNLVHKRPLDLMDTSVVKFRVLPNDIDLNFHMNNGRYLTIMDIARTDYVVRTGLHKVILKEKLSAVAAAVNIAFLKPLAPMSKYEIHTKVIAWDEMWFYIEQQFIQDDLIKANAIVKVTFLKGKKKMTPDSIIEKVPHKKVDKPEIPQYLKELIEGEEHLLTKIKEHNRKVKAYSSSNTSQV